MIVVAMGFVLLPMLRQRRTVDISRNEANVAVIKQQLAELDLDLKNGKLAQTEYAAGRIDLEKALLQDLSEDGASKPANPLKSNRWVIATLALAIPVVSVSLYQVLGNNDLLARSQNAGLSPSNDVAGEAIEQQSIEEMVARLAEHLRSQPDDIDGWIMLGRSNMFMQHYSDAVGAYANAYRLAGDTNASLLIEYAGAVAMANGRRLSGMPAELLRKALAIEPENTKGLWMMGQLHYEKRDFAEATNYFKRVAPMLPVGSEDSRIIAQQIQDAESKIDNSEQVDAARPAGTSVSSAKTITVHVELDPDLTEQLSLQDTLFIFARATEGPRMPLAIVRKQAKDLPVTVTLDDSTAMAPALMLSKFSTVTVGARISKSGNAMPQSGDLRGSVSPVDLGSNDVVRVTINDKIP